MANSPGGAERELRTPPYGPDWVLVLDDVAAGYGLPGWSRSAVSYCLFPAPRSRPARGVCGAAPSVTARPLLPLFFAAAVRQSYRKLLRPMNSRRMEVGGHEVGRRRQEAGEEIRQPPRLGVLRVVRLDLGEQRLDEGLQHGQLVVQRGVERDVGLVLEREDPRLLARAARWATCSASSARSCRGTLWSRTRRRTSRLSVVEMRLLESRFSCVSALM